WDDVLALQNDDPVALSVKPAEPAKQKETLIERILPGIRPAAPTHLKVAFVHERTPETSAWTSQHEFGRSQLETVFRTRGPPAAAPTHPKVALRHERTAETRGRTKQQEFGRSQLETVLADKVETAAYFDAVPGENADQLMEQAIAEGADIVFTTSPKLVGA